jgi:hypothetical protein
MDYFAGSVSASTRRAAHGLGAHAVVIRGHRRREDQPAEIPATV